MKRRIWFAGFAVSVLCVIALAADKTAPPAVDPAYQQAFDKWKGELVEDLKQEWLPLAGLFWLKPGENGFGSDPKNAIVFPQGAGARGSLYSGRKKGNREFRSRGQRNHRR